MTGTLRIEEVDTARGNNNVVATPFTPTSGSANFPDVSSFPTPFTFATSAPLTTASGQPITNRQLIINLAMAHTQVGVPVTIGTNLSTIQYRETINGGTPSSIANTYRNPTATGAPTGTVTLVSIVNNVYTFDLDAYLTPRGESDTGSFRLRGTVTIYAPNNSSVPNPM